MLYQLQINLNAKVEYLRVGTQQVIQQVHQESEVNLVRARCPHHKSFIVTANCHQTRNKNPILPAAAGRLRGVR
ncbi:MAG: hypothetical protein ACKPFD_04555 [Dolichospermum sp.]